MYSFLSPTQLIFDIGELLLSVWIGRISLNAVLSRKRGDYRMKVHYGLLMGALISLQIIQHIYGMSTKNSFLGLKDANPGSCWFFPVGLSLLFGVFISKRQIDFSRILTTVVGTNLCICLIGFIIDKSFTFDENPAGIEEYIADAVGWNGRILAFGGVVLLLIDLLIISAIFSLLYRSGVYWRIFLSLVITLFFDSAFFSLLRALQQGCRWQDVMIAQFVCNIAVSIATSTGISITLLSHIRHHHLVINGKSPYKQRVKNPNYTYNSVSFVAKAIKNCVKQIFLVVMKSLLIVEITQLIQSRRRMDDRLPKPTKQEAAQRLFYASRSELMQNHLGKWVAYSATEQITIQDSLRELMKAVSDAGYDSDDIVIRRVGKWSSNSIVLGCSPSLPK